MPGVPGVSDDGRAITDPLEEVVMSDTVEAEIRPFQVGFPEA
jgi:hypothetical protein